MAQMVLHVFNAKYKHITWTWVLGWETTWRNCTFSTGVARMLAICNSELSRSHENCLSGRRRSKTL
eukprot:5945385-Amphidinium_carterae.1